MAAVLESFEKDVIESSREVPILADFWAEWCGPCRALGPILEELEVEGGGSWRLAKVNVDEHQETAQAYQVRGIPACKLFHRGEVIAEFTGALPKAQVKQWLAEHLPSEEKDAIAQIDTLLEAGQEEEAASALESLHEANPEQIEVAARLARMVFWEDAARAAKLVEGVAQGDSLFEEADAIRTLHRLSLMAEPPDTSDEWVLYCAGNAALAEKDGAEALDRWIEAIEKGHRAVDDDGPRRACIAMFKLLGEDNEITGSRRRAFSSALF